MGGAPGCINLIDSQKSAMPGRTLQPYEHDQIFLLPPALRGGCRRDHLASSWRTWS